MANTENNAREGCTYTMFQKLTWTYCEHRHDLLPSYVFLLDLVASCCAASFGRLHKPTTQQERQ